MLHLKLRSLAVLLAVTIATVGCDEFDNLTDVNENPNAPTTLAPEYLLPSLIRGLATQLGGYNQDLGPSSLFIQHAARIQYASTDRLDLGEDYGNCCWSDYFTLSGDPPNGVFVLAKLMRDQAAAVESVNPNQVAVGKILTAYAAHNLTDMYGDVPYSQAVRPQRSSSGRCTTRRATSTTICSWSSRKPPT